MDQIYCTLFDSNYLDKGIALYQSMCKHMDAFKLYVFAFDDKCYEILSKENYQNMVVVPLSEFETDALLQVKKERSPAEYCWTCTPWVIKHVLQRYSEPICTYVDADMMFFSSAQCVFDEMHRRACSVIIVPHRYNSDKEIARERERTGEFCVEFNTFVNNEQGWEALNWWADRCLEWCYYAIPGTTQWYGDQKYLNLFPELFQGVYICDHMGVGLAPWNAARVCGVQTDGGSVTIKDKATGEDLPLILHHYENVMFLTERIINVSSRMPCKLLHSMIYDPYVEQIMQIRKDLEQRYGFVMDRKRRVLTQNGLKRFYQKYISPLRRIRKISDLYRVEGG